MYIYLNMSSDEDKGLLVGGFTESNLSWPVKARRVFSKKKILLFAKCIPYTYLFFSFTFIYDVVYNSYW